MKKVKRFLLSNVKPIIAFVIGIVISGGVVYAATIASSSVTYTKNGQSNVQGALDTLYTKANNWIDPSYIDFGTLATSTSKTILASKNGICIKRNNKVSCFKRANWNVEKNHIKQVFSDVSCNEYSDGVDCHASDFACIVRDYGSVYCSDQRNNSGCSVYSDGGYIECY